MSAAVAETCHSVETQPGPIVLKRQCLKARMRRLNREISGGASPADSGENRAPNRGGAPLGNQNRLIHGRYTRELEALRADLRAFRQHTRELVAFVDDLCDWLEGRRFPPLESVPNGTI